MIILPPFEAHLDHSHFDRCRLHYSLPPPPKVKKLSPMEIVWRKICEVAAKIWDLLFFWKSRTNFQLTDKQRRLIQQASQERKHLQLKPESVLRKKQESAYHLFAPLPRELEYPIDRTLRELCGFLEEFAKILLFDCVEEKSIRPHLSEWKESAKEKISQIKGMVGAVEGIIQHAAPLLKAFGDFKDPVKLIFSQLLIQVLLTPHGEQQEAKDKIERDLSDKIKKLLSEGEIGNDQYERLLALVQPALKWVFNPHNSFFNSRHPRILHAFLKDALEFFKTLATFVKTEEYDELIGRVNQEIDTHFEKGILELVKINTQPLTNLLAFRLSELIENAPFLDIYREFLKGVSRHLDSWIAAEKYRAEQEIAIAASKNDSVERPKEGDDFESHNRAKECLGNVQKAGGEQAYLERMFLRRFSETEGCDPDLKDFIQEDSPNLATLAQEEIIDKLIDLLLPILLPPTAVELPDGTLVEISGIQRLIDQVKYPKGFNELFKHYGQFFQRILNKGEFQDREQLTGYLDAIRKIFLNGLISNRIRNLLRKGFKVFIDKVCSKSYLDETVAEVILPSLIRSMLAGWIRSILLENSKEFAQLFQRIIETGSDSLDEKLAKNSLNEALHNKVKKMKVEFDMAAAGISVEAFEKIAAPLIFEISKHLIEKLKKDVPSRKISSTEISEAMEVYLKPNEATSIDTYGDIAMRALFDIGRLPEPNIMGFFSRQIKNTMRSSIVEKASKALHEVGTSHHFLVSTLVQAAKVKYLSAPTLMTTFYPMETSPEEIKKKEEAVERTLKTNLSRISSLIYDALYRSGWGARRVLPDKATLEEAISRLYQEVFKRPVPNQNLLLIFLQTVGKGLEKGEANLQERQKLCHKVKHLSKPLDHHE